MHLLFTIVVTHERVIIFIAYIGYLTLNSLCLVWALNEISEYYEHIFYSLVVISSLHLLLLCGGILTGYKAYPFENKNIVYAFVAVDILLFNALTSVVVIYTELDRDVAVLVLLGLSATSNLLCMYKFYHVTCPNTSVANNAYNLTPNLSITKEFKL